MSWSMPIAKIPSGTTSTCRRRHELDGLEGCAVSELVWAAYLRSFIRRCSTHLPPAAMAYVGFREHPEHDPPCAGRTPLVDLPGSVPACLRTQKSRERCLPCRPGRGVRLRVGHHRPGTLARFRGCGGATHWIMRNAEHCAFLPASSTQDTYSAMRAFLRYTLSDPSLAGAAPGRFCQHGGSSPSRWPCAACSFSVARAVREAVEAEIVESRAVNAMEVAARPRTRSTGSPGRRDPSERKIPRKRSADWNPSSRRTR